MILAVAQAPQAPEALAQAAARCGLLPYDLNQRLSGPLPRILLLGTEDRVAALCEPLAALGFITFTCEPAAVPGEEDYLIARRLELRPDGLVVFDPGGARHECPAAAISLFQCGQRTTTSSTTTKTSERKFSLGRAVLTGGLMVSKKVETETTQHASSTQSFLVAHRTDGGPDLLLYERQIDYRFLGSEMGPASRGNLVRATARLRELAPHALFDDRVGRPGFVSRLPQTAADPVDLALYLVRLAHLRLGALPPCGR